MTIASWHAVGLLSLDGMDGMDGRAALRRGAARWKALEHAQAMHEGETPGVLLAARS